MFYSPCDRATSIAVFSRVGGAQKSLGDSGWVSVRRTIFPFQARPGADNATPTVIANGLAAGNLVVTIAATDRGFSFSACGIFTKS